MLPLGSGEIGFGTTVGTNQPRQDRRASGEQETHRLFCGSGRHIKRLRIVGRGRRLSVGRATLIEFCPLVDGLSKGFVVADQENDEACRETATAWSKSPVSAIPFRARARSSSFCNLSVTHELCRGCLIADVPAIVGSLDVVMGEIRSVGAHAPGHRNGRLFVGQALAQPFQAVC